MAIFRVERTADFTVMSNHHLRNKELTLKAKGLLSQMLSLPENWDYTLSGLANINRESVDAIRTAVVELEKAGYIIRRQCRDEKGKLTGNEYTIFERPQVPCQDDPQEDSESAPPLLDFPITGEPTTDNPLSDNPLSENPTQLNKDRLSKDLLEKKSKKRKSAERASMDDTAIRNYWISWITEHAGDDWTRIGKNAVFNALMGFYAPREKAKQEPARTEDAVKIIGNRLIRYGQNSPTLMIEMLERATTAKWKSVFPIGGDKAIAKSDTSTGGEESRWL